MVNRPRRARGMKVLKAVSSPLRLQILNLLFDKGALSYTELMNSLKMNPSRDAGRFAYHLKPASGPAAEVHDPLAGPQQALGSLDLGELVRGARAEALPLGAPVVVVLALVSGHGNPGRG